MSTLNSRLTSTIDNLVEALYAQAQELVVELVKDHFAQRVGAPSKRGTAPAGAAVRALPAPKPGSKRSSSDIGAISSKILEHVRKHPGDRMEQISKAFGANTKDLRLPITKLIEEKKLKVKGQRRGTKYYLAGRG